jgi:hypothetical protein
MGDEYMQKMLDEMGKVMVRNLDRSWAGWHGFYMKRYNEMSQSTRDEIATAIRIAGFPAASEVYGYSDAAAVRETHLAFKGNK